MTFRIRDDILDCAIYFYEDEPSARSGKKAGASGFLMGRTMPGLNGRCSLWAVTNRHVIDSGGWTIRLNCKDGSIATVDTVPENWFLSPDDDLAVMPIKLSESIHKFKFITDDLFLQPSDMDDYGIGPGDSCFVIGRFINHDGVQKNTPTTRFGQIAQNPNEMVEVGGYRQESFLVEIRSIGGYSGSPVFVYLDPTYRRDILPTKDRRGREVAPGIFSTDPWLLGVDWCMVPTWERICDKSGQELSNEWMVPANSGMMGVIPAWKLLAIFEQEPVATVCQRLTEMAIDFERGRMANAVKTGEQRQE